MRAAREFGTARTPEQSARERSAAARTEILDHVQKIWSAYGMEDPYYSVLTDPAYRANSITTELAERFYKSGSDGVSRNLQFAFERNQIEMVPSWHILDLGCGVGRIGEHFCQMFEYYYGVDISANHLAHAARRLNQKISLMQNLACLRMR